MKISSPLRQTLQAFVFCLAVLFLSGAAQPALGATSTLTDLTSQLSVSFHGWKLDRATGSESATVTIRNNGTKALSGAFYFALVRNSRLRLATVSGSTKLSGKEYTYLDVTKQVTSALAKIGNRDARLNTGESVTFTVAIFTLDRTPLSSTQLAHILSFPVTVSTAKRAPKAADERPTVTVTAGESGVIAGVGCVSAVFSRTGSTADDLTVSWWTSGDAMPGVHYLTSTATVTIPKGVASVTERFPTIPDAQTATPKTLTVNIGSDPAYVVGVPSGAALTILYPAGR